MSWAREQLDHGERRRLFEETIQKAGHRIVQVTDGGENLVCRCLLPGHKDENPSFGYHIAKDVYTCATCGGGDLVRLYGLVEGLTISEALKAFAARYGVVVKQAGNKADPPQNASDSEQSKADNKFISESEWNQLVPM